MNDMPAQPELTWPHFIANWHLQPWWLVALALLTVGYLSAWRRAGHASTTPWWRVTSFVAGSVLTWVCVASGIGGYAMSLFWITPSLRQERVYSRPTAEPAP